MTKSHTPLIRSGGKLETFFQPAIGLIGRNDEILLVAVLVTCRYEPCCLSSVRTSATTKPADLQGPEMAFQTALREL